MTQPEEIQEEIKSENQWRVNTLHARTHSIA